jgi:hypothetical protein
MPPIDAARSLVLSLAGIRRDYAARDRLALLGAQALDAVPILLSSMCMTTAREHCDIRTMAGFSDDQATRAIDEAEGCVLPAVERRAS